MHHQTLRKEREAKGTLRVDRSNTLYSTCSKLKQSWFVAVWSSSFFMSVHISPICISTQKIFNTLISTYEVRENLLLHNCPSPQCGNCFNPFPPPPHVDNINSASLGCHTHPLPTPTALVQAMRICRLLPATENCHLCFLSPLLLASLLVALEFLSKTQF